MSFPRLQSSRGELRIHDDLDDLSNDLVEYVSELSEASVKERGVFAIALSGGSLIGLLGDTTGKIIRASTNFHPCIWGDFFINRMCDDNTAICKWRDEAERLKEQVKKMFAWDFGASEHMDKLNLIDCLQRLGIEYHFTGEIGHALEQIFLGVEKDYYCDLDLSTTSLLFRLLRQYGYPIHCDIFDKFKDENGMFKEDLVRDVMGMLNLYEAAHLRIHGEEILDDAVDFTKSNLKSMANHINNRCLANHVLHALDQPLRKSLTRLEAHHYISFYEESENQNQVLLKFAKLDFNILQKLHQKELSVITKWWKELDFETKLPFARSRIVELYFWITGVYFEPQYGLARKFLTKVIAMASVIDDTYDVYGSKEELELFTEAVNRWEIRAMDKLPEYMRFCYHALLDVYTEMEKGMAVKGGSVQFVHYAKEAMKTLVRAYFAETKWLNKEKMPTFEEYMKVALITSGYPMLTTSSFVGMEGIVTKEAFDWLLTEPKVVRAASTICRLMDDMVPQLDREREQTPSAVECYMKQYGVSEQEACNVLNRLVENAWKDVNQSFLMRGASRNGPLHPSMSLELLTRVLNLAQVMDVVYKHGDGYTKSNGRTKQYITSLLVEPIEIV